MRSCTVVYMQLPLRRATSRCRRRLAEQRRPRSIADRASTTSDAR